MHNRPMSGVSEAIKIVGGLTATARKLGVSPQAVWKWRTNDVVPSDRVPALSEVSGVPYHKLNPVFPAPQPRRPAAGQM
jgi:DNA-binding transcriptional regulator YdaS (Cro superfamily)